MQDAYSPGPRGQRLWKPPKQAGPRGYRAGRNGARQAANTAQARPYSPAWARNAGRLERRWNRGPGSSFFRFLVLIVPFVPLVRATIFRADYDRGRGEGQQKPGGRCTAADARGPARERRQQAGAAATAAPAAAKAQAQPTTNTAAGAIPENPAARQGEDSNKPRTFHDERRQRGTAGGRKLSFQCAKRPDFCRNLRRNEENCLKKCIT